MPTDTTRRAEIETRLEQLNIIICAVMVCITKERDELQAELAAGVALATTDAQEEPCARQ